MTADDGALVDAAYRAHRDALTRYVLSLVRDAEAAEELVQEAYLRLVREVQHGTTPDEPAAWLFRVAANLARSWGRRTMIARRRVSVAEPERREAAPDEVVIRRDRVAALEAGLARLPHADRRAVLLAAVGYRGPEIARLLGRTELATRALLCRARSRMRADGLVVEAAEG